MGWMGAPGVMRLTVWAWPLVELGGLAASADVAAAAAAAGERSDACDGGAVLSPSGEMGVPC